MTAQLTDPAGYDKGMRTFERSGLHRLRAALLAEVSGEVLEIGAGTGANLGHYSATARVSAVDLRPERLSAAASKHEASPSLALLACANAQTLPFLYGRFDAVVGTLVFCSISQPVLALAEIRRVLRPGGRLYLLEHVRGQTDLTRRLTDWLHPVWFALQGECHLNRETAASVAAAGFRVDHTSVHGRGLLQLIRATSV